MTPELVFRRPGGGRVAISADAQRTLLEHRQLSFMAREAGGLLLGRLVLGTDDIVVDQATIPDGQDRRSRFHFMRALAPAQARVDLSWNASRGTKIYLGEWHTHPEDVPHPSWIDERDWRRIVSKAKYEQSHLVFVIAGRIEIRVFEVDRARAISTLHPMQS